jgi:hypothetical protein
MTTCLAAPSRSSCLRVAQLQSFMWSLVTLSQTHLRVNWKPTVRQGHRVITMVPVTGAPTKLSSPQCRRPRRCQSRMPASSGLPSRFPGRQLPGQGDGPRTHKTRCGCLALAGAANSRPTAENRAEARSVRNPSSRESNDCSSRARVVGRAHADSLFMFMCSTHVQFVCN